MLTRFAPAPTGALHLGHVANAIYVWGLAGRRGAEVLLRIEDHDGQRSRRAYRIQLLDDLDWLGFVPDRYPTNAFRTGMCESRQSDRERVHLAAARGLIARGAVYGCRCSRPQQRGRDATRHHSTTRYPGTCRGLGIEPGEGVTWRVRIDPGVEVFDDLLLGPETQHPATEFGDVVIRDRLGNWSYQFAVAVDDFLQDLDLVIRGRDLLSSTGLQIQLGRMLGRTVPACFGHHPLIMKSPAQKLSKSDGDSGIHAMRDDGLRPADVIGRAAHMAGLRDRTDPIDATDVARLFV